VRDIVTPISARGTIFSSFFFTSGMDAPRVPPTAVTQGDPAGQLGEKASPGHAWSMEAAPLSPEAKRSEMPRPAALTNSALT